MWEPIKENKCTCNPQKGIMPQVYLFCILFSRSWRAGHDCDAAWDQVPVARTSGANDERGPGGVWWSRRSFSHGQDCGLPTRHCGTDDTKWWAIMVMRLSFFLCKLVLLLLLLTPSLVICLFWGGEREREIWKWGVVRLCVCVSMCASTVHNIWNQNS